MMLFPKAARYVRSSLGHRARVEHVDQTNVPAYQRPLFWSQRGKKKTLRAPGSIANTAAFSASLYIRLLDFFSGSANLRGPSSSPWESLPDIVSSLDENDPSSSKLKTFPWGYRLTSLFMIASGN